jgi:protocatechuate 3,4-dioxygenase alpha subunit
MSELRLFSPTASQTVGPFYAYALTPAEKLGRLWTPEVQGERIRVRLEVTDGEGAPVIDAMIEIWQADSQGRYPHPDDPRSSEADPKFRGFGRLSTDPNGICVFDTVKPGAPAGQAAHINTTVFARGLLNHQCTRLYFAGDPLLERDPVLALVPEERRHTLIATQDANDPSQWNLNIRLQGEDETVFFEI